MPELPEVEVITRGLTPHVMGQTFLSLSFSNKKLRVTLPKTEARALLQGATVIGVARRAKYITISMDNGALLVIHLGMTGNLGIFPKGSKRAKHDHVRFLMDNGMELRYNDTRRFGSIRVFATMGREQEEFFKNMGPEPFSDDFSGEYLSQRAHGKSKPIKNFLMDSHIVVGIGNIYANEILFAAGVNPTRAVDEISLSNWQRIITKTQKILTQAIAAGGSTISDFVNSSGEKGYFQLSLQVYGRKGENCPKCDAPIIKTNMAGRATFFCSKCQK